MVPKCWIFSFISIWWHKILFSQMNWLGIIFQFQFSLNLCLFYYFSGKMKAFLWHFVFIDHLIWFLQFLFKTNKIQFYWDQLLFFYCKLKVVQNCWVLFEVSVISWNILRNLRVFGGNARLFHKWWWQNLHNSL